MTLEARTTRHSTPAAVDKQRYPTNPERVPACNRRRSNSCKPSASFLPPSVDAKRHLVNTRPRTPVADFAPRGRAATDRIMSECQRPRVSDVMMATPTAPSSVAAASACEPQETQAPGRDHDHCSHLENLERCRHSTAARQPQTEVWPRPPPPLSAPRPVHCGGGPSPAPWPPSSSRDGAMPGASDLAASAMVIHGTLKGFASSTFFED